MKPRDNKAKRPSGWLGTTKFGGHGRYALSLVAVVVSIVFVVIVLDER